MKILRLFLALSLHFKGSHSLFSLFIPLLYVYSTTVIFRRMNHTVYLQAGVDSPSGADSPRNLEILTSSGASYQSLSAYPPVSLLKIIKTTVFQATTYYTAPSTYFSSELPTHHGLRLPSITTSLGVLYPPFSWLKTPSVVHNKRAPGRCPSRPDEQLYGVLFRAGRAGHTRKCRGGGHCGRAGTSPDRGGGRRRGRPHGGRDPGQRTVRIQSLKLYSKYSEFSAEYE